MRTEIARLDALFTEHYPAMLAWARRRLRSDLGDPADLVHQAYLRCRGRFSAARMSIDHSPAYAYRALGWVLIDVLRRHRRQSARMRNPPDWLARGADCDSPLAEASARESILALRGRERQVCQAVLAGKTHRQIQQELRLSAAALAVHLSRARGRLTRISTSNA